ncbi:MAG TPA: hypothetical protein VKZ63_17415 [Kofleriaceae bacterium]|nr:hypothetical protein [Kofleriaceae bacterium]
MRRRAAARTGLVALAAAAACSQEIAPPPVRNIDRPTDVAFACYGDLRVNGGDPAASGELVVSAQPIESCLAHARGEIPPGQEPREGEPPLSTPRMFGFVVQSGDGTVAVVDSEAQTVLDSDPLTPGKNSIPIGTLPVGIAPDRSGCYMLTANAGSCDLTALDVTSALDIRSEARISRIPVTSSTGERLRARPRTITAGAAETTIGLECPGHGEGAVRPEGLVYVAYPACHLVAAIDTATGQVTGGVQFAEDGSATITDGAVTCPSECGDGAIVPTGGPIVDAGPDGGPDGGALDGGPGDAGPPTIDDTAPRPVAVERGPDGRLYIASENSPILTVVELDDAGLPVSSSQVQLEGGVGITALAVSDAIQMGGSRGTLGGSAGEFRFAYAVATDRTVRVVNLGAMVECDTQVDPRFLYDVRDVARLSCLPVGDPDTPPRRAGARSPGIQFPRGAAPLDVSIAVVDPGGVGERSPVSMVGAFAFVTTSDGFVYVVNIDDDNYPDFENPDDPAAASMPLALAHQLRDFVRGRDAVAGTCGYPIPEPLDLPPRAAEPPVVGYSEERIAPGKLGLMPTLHQVLCTAGEDTAPVSELAFSAPVEVRERTYADWGATTNESFTITWEGPLSRDTSGVAVDGPSVRVGSVVTGDGAMTLEDPSESFCQIGVEPYDIAALVGCDPSLGDGQCGLGESCYVHPDSPTVVQSGVCLRSEQVDALSGPCRDFLITSRRYSVRESASGRLELVPRRRALRTSPVAGCESDAQCQLLADQERAVASPEHPIDLEAEEGDEEVERSWTCAPDPTRAPGPDRCQMTCETAEDCEPGHGCDGGFCVEGVVPPQQCVSALQRYQIRASEAFVVIGDRTGYLHDLIRDPDTGMCVPDPDASPLLQGRIPLVAPPCTGDGFGDVSPNPCSTTVAQVDRFVPFEPEGGRCVARAEELRTRQAEAIRLTNPVFRMHLVDPTTTGDAVCIGDRAADLPAFSPVYPGFQFGFSIVGGFFPMFVTPIEASFPNAIVPAPDGRLWVLDEGDDVSSRTEGRVFTFVPAAPEAFGVIIIL